MPRTEIKIKTWGCDGCNYSQDFEQTQENIDRHFRFDLEFVNKGVIIQPGGCPSCALKGEVGHKLLPVISTEKQMTLIVTGEEDIELEIEERIEETYRVHRLAEVARYIESMDVNGEFPTSVAKDRLQAQRELDVEDDITSLKDMDASDPNGPAFSPQGYFLTTSASITNYRTKRLADISKAITKARELEN